MPNTILTDATRPRLRFYRTAADGLRTHFTVGVDREVPLVGGVTIVGSNDELASIITIASDAGLGVVVTRVGGARAILIRDASEHSARHRQQIPVIDLGGGVELMLTGAGAV